MVNNKGRIWFEDAAMIFSGLIMIFFVISLFYLVISDAVEQYREQQNIVEYCESIGETAGIYDWICMNCYVNVAGVENCVLGSRIPREMDGEE